MYPSQLDQCSLAIETPSNLFGQYRPLDLQRSSPGKIPPPDHVAAEPLVVRQPPVPGSQLISKTVGEFLSVLEPQGDDKLFAGHRLCRPHVVRSEHAELLDGKPFERGFDVFGIHVLAAFGHDHVLNPAEELTW